MFRSSLKPSNGPGPLPGAAPARSLRFPPNPSLEQEFCSANEALDYAQQEFAEACNSLNAKLHEQAEWLGGGLTKAQEDVHRLEAQVNQAQHDLDQAIMALEAHPAPAWRFPWPGETWDEVERLSSEQKEKSDAAAASYKQKNLECTRAREALKVATDILNQCFDTDIDVCRERVRQAASAVQAAKEEHEGRAFLVDDFSPGSSADSDAQGMPALRLISQQADAQGPWDMTDSDDHTQVNFLSPMPGGNRLAAQQADELAVVATLSRACVNAISGEASSAEARNTHVMPLALTPGERPSRSLTINEDANVVQIFSPWGRAVLSDSDDSSALEKHNYMKAVLSLERAENMLQDLKDVYFKAYAHHSAKLQSGFRFANEEIEAVFMGNVLKPQIKNIFDMQTAVNCAREKADAAWEALQLSVDEIPVLLSTTTNGAGTGVALKSTVADAHVLSNQAGVVPLGDLFRLGSAIDDSDDDEATMLQPSMRTNSFDGDDVKVLLPPPVFGINLYEDWGLELSEEAQSEEFDII